jgi:hypothetical protein
MPSTIRSACNENDRLTITYTRAAKSGASSATLHPPRFLLPVMCGVRLKNRRVTMRRKSKAITFAILLAFVCISTAQAQQYYMFKFSCHYNNGMKIRYSHWMDERVSNTVTIDDYINRSCERVDLQLLPLRRGAHFNQSDDQAKERTTLWREWAPMREANPNQVITWTAGRARNPDRVSTTWVTSEGRERRRISWTREWPDNYWFVEYFVEGQEENPSPKRFRTRVEYTDGMGHVHEFIAVPWAKKATPNQ